VIQGKPGDDGCPRTYSLNRERNGTWEAAWRQDKAVDHMSKRASVPFWTEYGFAHQQLFLLVREEERLNTKKRVDIPYGYLLI
jgi:hypothetical protein